jgi:hypothetical protein
MYRNVFLCVLGALSDRGLLKGKTVGVDIVLDMWLPLRLFPACD